MAALVLDGKVPSGPLPSKWQEHKNHLRLVNPNNKRKFTVLVVGSGLAGASAAASLAELGYRVKCFCFQDTPRRAHSIAAQGGINAAKNYHNDGDSVFRLFYDTIKGGDFRSREANVYRLAELSAAIIDQCVAQGVPFAREYGGLLDNRSFGGAQVSRTFYARGQTGQQLLLGAYQALCREIAAGKVRMSPRTEMLDLVVAGGRVRGILTRDLVSGKIRRHAGHAVVLATGGYSNVYYLSTNAKGCNVTAIWRAHRRGAAFANPCFTQIHPTCIPASGDYQSKLTLMSESLRNDGRIWVPRDPGDARAPEKIPEGDRDYFLESRYPAFGNLVPRDVAARNCKQVVDGGRGVGPQKNGVFLDLGDAIRRLGRRTIADRYGNLFEMYEKITGDDPYVTPMRIYPAPHYTMGGLWVDYNLMSNIDGLFVLGEANFSDHGANRLGASALMQGLADGYFVLPQTLGNYLAGHLGEPLTTDGDEYAAVEAEVRARLERLLALRGERSADSFHRQLGHIVWHACGIARQAAGLRAAREEIAALAGEFWQNLRVSGAPDEVNQDLERAGRVADFFELADLMCRDALDREESCGGHFREEHQTPEGEALRDDERYAFVSAWEWQGAGKPQLLHKEPLHFEYIEPSRRSYK
ncbi:MAG TPA: fumarate reductase/succinate dehydrogenase flavoprotein subunit [Thermoanaerobaculia bacterium]|nr:fumarate reductase/succinate dehydrogenase flavoprotein subunit [Thermoanaerobaculia bacterium]